ncbi:MAG: phage holin [Candidatus Caldatribacterium sp.]|nr:phage holin [Candidatus Caldatribacterium sp.]
MLELVLDVVLVVLPAVLSVLLARFLKEKGEGEKLLRILRLAEEAVLFAEDAFPNSPGVEKLKKAIEYLRGALAKAGIKLEDKELEAKVRAAYQRLQGEALERILERLRR